MSVFVHLAQTNTAYAPARFVNLINKYTEHRAYLIQARGFVFGNPLGIVCPKTIERIQEILDKADVLHIHGNHIYDKKKIAGIKIDKHLQRKPFVLHYHGTPQREQARRCQRNVPLLVSTPEMLPLFPIAKYFPNLIDETHEIYTKRKKQNKKLKICHHFSFHWKLKDTGFFDAAKAQFIQNGNSLNFVMLEQMALVDALNQRASCDVCFDHLQGYYGFISIESMAQGLLVANGCNAQSQKEIKDFFFGELPPFFYTSKKTFVQDLKKITPEMVDEYGAKGIKFMHGPWAGKKNIERLVRYYEKL